MCLWPSHAFTYEHMNINVHTQAHARLRAHARAHTTADTKAPLKIERLSTVSGNQKDKVSWLEFSILSKKQRLNS